MSRQSILRASETLPEIRVADEVFIATALLHREHPGRQDFTVEEIVDRASRENLAGVLRPGVRIHASLHCVANREPNPARLRMLYATGRSRRRLLLPGDDVHPARTGKTFPKTEDVPPRYVELIQWAKQRFAQSDAPARRWLDSILQLRGMGKHIWKDEDPDEYVERLRADWK